jgi:hypothetical protein
MTDEDVLAAETLIGDDADKFMRSDLGRTIMGIAKQEAEIAFEDLKHVDPNDVNKVRELQNIIWRAESFEAWLLELVKRGEQALQIMEYDEEYQ